MFTGLVEEKGSIISLNNGDKSIKLKIKANKVLENVKLGDSSAIPFINGFNFDSMEDVFKLSNPKFNIYGDNISIEFENL